MRLPCPGRRRQPERQPRRKGSGAHPGCTPPVRSPRSVPVARDRAGATGGGSRRRVRAVRRPRIPVQWGRNIAPRSTRHSVGARGRRSAPYLPAVPFERGPGSDPAIGPVLRCRARAEWEGPMRGSCATTKLRIPSGQMNSSSNGLHARRAHARGLIGFLRSAPEPEGSRSRSRNGAGRLRASTHPAACLPGRGPKGFPGGCSVARTAGSCPSSRGAQARDPPRSEPRGPSHGRPPRLEALASGRS